MTKLIWEIVVIVLFLFLFRKPLWSALRVINSKKQRCLDGEKGMGRMADQVSTL